MNVKYCFRDFVPFRGLRRYLARQEAYLDSLHLSEEDREKEKKSIKEEVLAAYNILFFTGFSIGLIILAKKGLETLLN